MWNFFLFVILCINDGKSSKIYDKYDLRVAQAMHQYAKDIKGGIFKNLFRAITFD